jgi:hypothetical protein
MVYFFAIIPSKKTKEDHLFFYFESELALPLPPVSKHTQNGYLLFIALNLSSPCVYEKGYSYISYIAGVRVSQFQRRDKKHYHL